ncbi:hypothetical protein P3T76_007039 [Phytophthora citrophthora]|uniref:Uncharacterized protein n=2 Tax=Phytophthora citrophthora TaxID=4793 RepID=A0AAD9GMZ9_9STRA|nr:hypothetical protein P3T76_007039 [Phytophthora citrophthora]
MLPSLSDRWGATLQVLLPSSSESTNVSTRRDALVELKKVNAIRISSSGKGSQTRYEVEVTMASSSPTACSDLSVTSTEHATRTEREQSDFKEVADELHDIVNSAHSGKRCNLCSAILTWYVFGENPDGVRMLFISKERIARKFTTFLEDLLATTIKFTSDEISSSCCSGQTLIPIAVHKFMLNPRVTCDAA